MIPGSFQLFFLAFIPLLASTFVDKPIFLEIYRKTDSSVENAVKPRNFTRKTHYSNLQEEDSALGPENLPRVQSVPANDKIKQYLSPDSRFLKNKSLIPLEEALESSRIRILQEQEVEEDELVGGTSISTKVDGYMIYNTQLQSFIDGDGQNKWVTAVRRLLVIDPSTIQVNNVEANENGLATLNFEIVIGGECYTSEAKQVSEIKKLLEGGISDGDLTIIEGVGIIGYEINEICIEPTIPQMEEDTRSTNLVSIVGVGIVVGVLILAALMTVFFIARRRTSKRYASVWGNIIFSSNPNQ